MKQNGNQNGFTTKEMVQKIDEKLDDFIEKQSKITDIVKDNKLKIDILWKIIIIGVVISIGKDIILKIVEKFIN